MPTIVAELFPTLASIATAMASQPISTSPTPEQEEIPMLLHLILKTYKTSIVLSLGPHQMSAESIVPWGRLLFQVVNLQLPSEILPADEEEREKCEWWKVKKWAYGTLWRLFSRFVRYPDVVIRDSSMLLGMVILHSYPLLCKENMVHSHNTSSPPSPQK